MKLTLRSWEKGDFEKIRNFLVAAESVVPGWNWQLDRWNFSRSFSQVMHNTTEIWPETVGVWVDRQGFIKAVVHSEGENRGEAFIQFGSREWSGDQLKEFVTYAEKHLKKSDGAEDYLLLCVPRDFDELNRIMEDRGYSLLDWMESESRLELVKENQIKLPEGLCLKTGAEVDDEAKALAHAQAFGYEEQGISEGSLAYRALQKAPDYHSDLDLYLVNEWNEVVSFACIWLDRDNRRGILEPVGTIPAYRRKGLGKILIHEGGNRLFRAGIEALYVGSDVPFYLSLGFDPVNFFCMWEKRWKTDA